jgi:osmotically-inducible protein OsmY
VNREVKADGGRHSRQNAQEGKVRSATAMQQGAGFRDRQNTDRINQAIRGDSRLSANAKNVEVVTLHGQTTLRGHVNTLNDRNEIGAIAAKLGRPENVSNQLEVRPQR